jgi:hypothetical protein
MVALRGTLALAVADTILFGFVRSIRNLSARRWKRVRGALSILVNHQTRIPGAGFHGISQTHAWGYLVTLACGCLGPVVLSGSFVETNL